MIKSLPDRNAYRKDITTRNKLERNKIFGKHRHVNVTGGTYEKLKQTNILSIIQQLNKSREVEQQFVIEYANLS